MQWGNPCHSWSCRAAWQSISLRLRWPVPATGKVSGGTGGAPSFLLSHCVSAQLLLSQETWGARPICGPTSGCWSSRMQTGQLEPSSAVSGTQTRHKAITLKILGSHYFLALLGYNTPTLPPYRCHYNLSHSSPMYHFNGYCFLLSGGYKFGIVFCNLAYDSAVWHMWYHACVHNTHLIRIFCSIVWWTLVETTCHLRIFPLVFPSRLLQ